VPPRSLSRRAALLAGAALLGGCAIGGPAGQPTRLRAPLTYVAIGASDAVGVGVEDPEQDGWVSVLHRALPRPTRLVNLGIPGIRLGGALAVELPPALEARPDLVTVWLAVNDLLGGVALEAYRADLDRLLGRLREETGAVVALGNVPDAPETRRYLGMEAAERRRVAAAWNETIAAAAERHGAILVDLFARWPSARHPEYIGLDGLHPTALGYRALAETFLSALRERRVV
jgi:lysophospholipase L1-like esterase